MKAFVFVLNILCGGVAMAAPSVDMDYVRAIKLGGDTTIFIRGQSVQAYRNPAANLSEEDIHRHLTGDALF